MALFNRFKAGLDTIKPPVVDFSVDDKLDQSYTFYEKQDDQSYKNNASINQEAVNAPTYHNNPPKQQG